MTHRLLLGLVFFSLLSVAQSDELRYDTTGENWNLGSSDEAEAGHPTWEWTRATLPPTAWARCN